jgi:hypothetical protein
MNDYNFINKRASHTTDPCSIADTIRTRSGRFLTPGSRIQDMFFPDPVSLIRAPTHILRASDYFMGKNYLNSSSFGSNSFCMVPVHFFAKKSKTTFPHPFVVAAGIWDAGFRMDKIQDPGSGISIQDL